MPDNKYRAYFDIDEEYFPQVNDSAIAAASADFWMRTYPHETFIEMLRSMERAMAGSEKRSLWIEGAYGTGKSQCAYALKRLLEVPEEELRDYWAKYEPLKSKTDLLEKLIGHKQRGIVTAYRYASGGIFSPRELFLAMQDTLRAALVDANLYVGEDTLKESVIAWIDRPANKRYFDDLLSQPEYASVFSQSSAEEILIALRKSGDVESLMNNIFRLADKEGITALNIDADRLIAWLSDIIDRNNVKIIFIWDEFSDYFKNNRESLSELQKLAELVNLKPFFFIPVTHESGQLYTTADTTWTKVRDRFIPAKITLPDNIAFELIGHAFNVKLAAKVAWDTLVDGDLGSRTNNARSKVMTVAKIVNPQVMKSIMPLHPMAALLLKNIASAFKSNQRSMFDFIKSSNADDVKAFQWFIENTGPFDDRPLLTVDMLWNFFYEKGRDNLTPDIRMILDTFPQQQNLRADEKAVLKAILIMQAIDQRLGGAIDLFKPTGQNLSYVFEGISDLEGATKAENIAKGLKDKGILVASPLSGGRIAYQAAVLAGDQSKIDAIKETLRGNPAKNINPTATTQKLVSEGGLSTVLSLPPALRLRFESEPGTGKITPVTVTDFTRTINILREKATGWNFHAVIAFAKDDAEAATFRRTLRAAVAEKNYANIVFIDALSIPLGLEAFEQYVEYAAMSQYYQGNQTAASRENADKAKRVLDQEWKNRIYNGQFVVYTYDHQEGEKLGNGQGVAGFLQTIVQNKFPYAFDFAKNLTEVQLKLTSARQCAKFGILKTSGGIVGGIEKNLFPTAWGIDRYWEDPATASLPISKIKTEVDKLIEAAFEREGEGRISIGDVYDFLEKTYGFAPCNLSAFIAGFLLKEYSSEPYSYNDSVGGHEPMTPDKLAEMLGNYFGKYTSKAPKTTYIVQMTAQERAFYELTERAWNIAANSCSSTSQAALAVAAKMRGLKLPIWCLEEVDSAGVFDVVRMYTELVQKEGSEAHRKAMEIGKIALTKPSLANHLSALLTSENCQQGMREYLHTFEKGKFIELAKDIGAQDNILADIRRLFGVKHACLWDKRMGEDEIHKLLSEYGVVKESNAVLSAFAHSLSEAYKEWREKLRFYGISCEALRAKHPPLARIFDTLLKIYKQDEVLPEQLKVFRGELMEHGAEIRELLNNDGQAFAEVYAPYLEGLSTGDIATVKTNIGTGLFDLPKSTCNSKVKEAAEAFRKNQLKTQLFTIWKAKTGTKNPREWSSRYRTPILCLISQDDYEWAKKVFDTLNRSWGTDVEIKAALNFLEKTTMFDVLNDAAKRNAAFKRDIVGTYSLLLPDLDQIREALDHLAIDVYDWRDHPKVKAKIEELADAEYNAGGSDKALQKIDEMDETQLKVYLKRLVKDSKMVGMEILANGGE